MEINKHTIRALLALFLGTSCAAAQTVEAPSPGSGEDLDTPVDATMYDAESHPNDPFRVRDLGNKVGYIRSNNWIRFDAFDFGDGADAF